MHIYIYIYIYIYTHIRAVLDAPVPEYGFDESIY